MLTQDIAIAVTSAANLAAKDGYDEDCCSAMYVQKYLLPELERISAKREGQKTEVPKTASKPVCSISDHHKQALILAASDGKNAAKSAINYVRHEIGNRALLEILVNDTNNVLPESMKAGLVVVLQRKDV